MIRFITGSKNDFRHLQAAEDIFAAFGVSYQIHAYSCHRDVKELIQFLDTLANEEQKTKIIIAIANSVANLPAIIAGYLKGSGITVIGVGLSGDRMGGVDSLTSIATIPKKVPLLTTGIDQVGMTNAALASLEILAQRDEGVKNKLREYYAAQM